jgi:hypothetical protein
MLGFLIPLGGASAARDRDLEQPRTSGFDDERLKELTEGWVPVVTPMGKGILLFENCD